MVEKHRWPPRGEGVWREGGGEPLGGGVLPGENGGFRRLGDRMLTLKPNEGIW